ncbi:MAG TPA: FecR domain-containing protein, partial [Luteolibacter sp.]|nr:FecR domain-containing protein [Luteolibacter sp.]
MNHSEEEFRGLIARVLDHTGDEVGMNRLVSLCREHPELSGKFGGQAEVDRLLEIALGERAGISFGAAVVRRIESTQDGGASFVGSVMGKVERISRWRRIGGRSAVGIAAVAMLWAGIVWFLPSPAAELHRGDTAKWSHEAPSGRLLAGQRLLLESGLAEVHFLNGAEIILEGPADLEIRGKNNGFLHRGRVSVRVPEHAVGFTIDSPGGKMVDLGTAFGMNVGEKGDTETEVFEGKVQVKPRGADSRFVLARNEKFTAGHSGWTKSNGINENAFVTNLPPKADAVPRFVHWALDEGKGTIASPQGELAGDGIPAVLRDLSTDQPVPPRWIEGPFGSALSFDGRGQAMETNYPGPTGDAARTVAFWLRLPADFDPEQGYGIVSWGDLSEEGNAWQISINPYAHEGPVGMLRVGIFPSLVTGSTDLRDGKWHHCAVVLYKDERNDQRVPILMYVDGKMESTAIKGVVSDIHTSALESSRPVWIAKSLRHIKPRESRGTGFFR